MFLGVKFIMFRVSNQTYYVYFSKTSNEKPIYRRELPKKGGLGQFADLRGFGGGGGLVVDTIMHTCHIFSGSLKVFGFLVMLLYIFDKGNILRVFGFSVTIFVLLFVKLMKHILLGVYIHSIFIRQILSKKF